MKILLTFSFTLIFLSSFASTKITVADGDWFDANNWIPSGVPLMEDTVIIDHAITITGNTVDFGANWLIINPNASLVSDTIFGLHGNLKVYGTVDIRTFAVGDGDSTLVYGLVGGYNYYPGNPTNMNYGTIESDTLIAGDAFENYGLIDVAYFVSATDLTNRAGAAILVSGATTLSTLTMNEATATMNLSDLVTNEAITNNGDISCLNWTLGTGTADGSGKYCIALCFLNAGDIMGTLDICDATPGGFCDFQMGTIAGTVTFCAASPCQNNLAVEVIEEELNIYPNPATAQITLKISASMLGMTYHLVNYSGQIVQSGIFDTTASAVDISSISKGMYLLNVEGSTVRQKFIKN